MRELDHICDDLFDSLDQISTADMNAVELYAHELVVAAFYLRGQVDAYEVALLPRTRAARKAASIDEIVSRNIAQSKGKR